MTLPNNCCIKRRATSYSPSLCKQTIFTYYRNLERAEAQIGELSVGLEDVDKQVSVLREKLNRSTKEAAEVEFHLNKAKETISAAESLVTKLEGEYQRWSQQVRMKSSVKVLQLLGRKSKLSLSSLSFYSKGICILYIDVILFSSMYIPSFYSPKGD